ncbi:MAG: YcaO-like family protein, partial [Lentisphaerae bacterium]|nr:YcaO-like family protein [Lentisphaerota bacterium]
MNLKNCPKLKCGKAETPENTVAYLHNAISAIHNYTYLEQKVADHLYWSAMFIDDLDFRAMGKGISPIMCRAGALAEGAEWLTSREAQTLPGYTTAHQDDLGNVLGIEELLSHIGTLTASDLKRIKNSDCAQYWADGYSLINGRTIKVPIEYVRRISGPSGLAAGNAREEAIEHALCEIFERRAHITTLRYRLTMPTIDVNSIQNDIVQEQLDFIRSKNIEVYLKDLSFGGELPCVGAYFKDRNIPENFQFHHFFKVGSAFDREEALIRCFTEYVQGRKLDEFIKGQKEEQTRVLKDDFRALQCMPDDGDNFLSSFMFGMVPYADAEFMQQGEVVAFDKGIRYNDFLDDINKALEILKRLAKDCIVVDFTDPEIGFPVIQVIVPGYSDVLPYYPSNSTVLFK